MKRRIPRIVIVFGSLVVAVAVIFLIHFLVATAMVRSEKAALARDHIPTSWAELMHVLPQIDPQRTAQSHLFSAMEGLMKQRLPDDLYGVVPVEGMTNIPPLNQAIPKGMMEALSNRLEEVSPVLNAIRQAMDQEPFWLAVPTNAWLVGNVGRFSAARQTARLFEMTTILQAESGNSEGAVRAVADGCRLARILDRGGLVIDGLVRIACEGLAIRSIEITLAKINPTTQEMEELKSCLSDLPGDMRTCLLGEVVWTISTYEVLPRRGIVSLVMVDGKAPLWQYVAPYVTGWTKMNEALSLRHLHQDIDSWSLPWSEFHALHKTNEERIPRFYFAARMMSSSTCEAVRNRDLRAKGSIDSARVGIAVEEFVQQNGRLPNDLTELVPQYIDKLPNEPFFGKPLTYVREGNKGVISFDYPDSENQKFTFEVYSRPAAQ